MSFILFKKRKGKKKKKTYQIKKEIEKFGPSNLGGWMLTRE